MAATPAGDLYVRLVVTLPDKPDESLRNFARAGPPTTIPAPRCVKPLILL